MSPRTRSVILFALLGVAVPSVAAPPSSPTTRDVACTMEAPLTPELAIAAERYKMPSRPGGGMNPKPGEWLGVSSVACGMSDRHAVRESLTEILRRESCKTSAVVSGVVKASRFYLTPGRDWIVGEYDLEVDEVFRNSRGPLIKAGSTLAMMRSGGVVCAENGGRMDVSHNLEPLPAIGGRYLFFLDWDGKAKRYYSSELSRVRAAFKLDDSAQIERLAERPESVDEGVTPALLLEEVRFVSGGCAE